VARFDVSTGQVDATAGALHSLAAVFDQQVESADSAVSAVVGASWTGASADEFAASWQVLLATAASTRTALSSIISRMESAGVVYAGTETANAAASRAMEGAFGRVSGGSAGQTQAVKG